MAPKVNLVRTEIYTTEASESRKQAQADVSVPDPTLEDAEKAIATNTILTGRKLSKSECRRLEVQRYQMCKEYDADKESLS